MRSGGMWRRGLTAVSMLAAWVVVVELALQDLRCGPRAKRWAAGERAVHGCGEAVDVGLRAAFLLEE